MASGPNVYATNTFGPSQVIRLPGTSLTTTLTVENFASTKNPSNLLDWIGFDMSPDPAFERRSNRTQYGYDYWTGPQYHESLLFSWRLQLLNPTQVEILVGIIELQRRNESRARLENSRVVTVEKNPRTRGRVAVATVTNAQAGLNYFFGLYNIELIGSRDSFTPHGVDRNTGLLSYKGNLQAREMQLVPTSEDIA